MYIAGAPAVECESKDVYRMYIAGAPAVKCESRDVYHWCARCIM